MTTILIIYCAGVLINAFAAASVWDDLKDERKLEKVMMTTLLLFVLASVLTWAYATIYLVCAIVKDLIKRKQPKSDEDETKP